MPLYMACVPSICHDILFREGFEYHRQSMILLSPIFRYLYQICVSGIRGPNTDPWGTTLLT